MNQRKVNPATCLRFGHVQTEKEEYHKAYIRWAEAVKERTNGDFVIEVYPNAQLGVEEDILEQMRKGSNVGWQTDPARLGDYVEEFSVLYGAYLLSGYDDFEGLLGSPTINSWSKKLEDEFGIKVLSYAYAQGFRNVMANVQARSPRELRGVRIRDCSCSCMAVRLSIPWGPPPQVSPMVNYITVYRLVLSTVRSFLFLRPERSVLKKSRTT